MRSARLVEEALVPEEPRRLSRAPGRVCRRRRAQALRHAPAKLDEEAARTRGVEMAAVCTLDDWMISIGAKRCDSV
eukprot:6191993-Pleurochrysis_carterae.AAC.3